MEPVDRNRPFHVKRRGLFFIMGIGMLVASVIAAYWPDAVARFYTDGLGQALGRILARASGLIPISLAAPVTAMYVLSVVWPAPAAIYHVFRRERGIRNVLACAALRSAAALGIVITAFYLLWGLNYSDEPLAQRLGWQTKVSTGTNEDKSKDHLDELENLCDELVLATNAAYKQAFDSNDIGHTSSYDSLSKVDGALDRAYERVACIIPVGTKFAVSRGPAKSFFPGMLMSYAGISGFYSPWTGEATINPDVPACQLPHVLAHEKAHQRGIANEAEANFVGFLACVSSDDPYARYAGLLFAQRQLLMEVLARDPANGEVLVKKRLPGVQRDVTDMKKFWAGYQGKARTISLAVNDAYLKANRVEGGLNSYNLSARLLVLFARNNGGSCIPPATTVAKNEDGRVRSGSDAAAGS